MIIVKDWIAVLPEEDKHIAFVGEHQSVTRQFLLTGADWQEYADWGFHLDMAFDLSTVTSSQQHKMEKTQVNNTENITETQIKNTGSTTKDTYTVEEVEVDCAAETDIALLTKTEQEDGLCLTWQVLRQQTQLPGALKATIRALGPRGQIKKSSMMVFEVEPAVVANAAADIPESEFEQAERYVDGILDTVTKSAQTVEHQLERSEEILKQVTAAESSASSWSNQARAWGIRAETWAECTQTEMRQNKLQTDRMFESRASGNLLDLNAVTYGKGMDKSGAIGSTSQYDLSLTGFIPVKAGDRISYQRTNIETGKRELWCFYLTCLFDKYKQVTMTDYSIPPGEDGTVRCVTIPEGVSYVRFTLHDLSTSLEPALVLGDELIPHEPYSVTYWLNKDAYRLDYLAEILNPVQTTPQELTEAQKKQVRENIDALPADFTFPVDGALNENSRNAVSNIAVAMTLKTKVFPHLLPQVGVDDTYKILRVGMNGECFEFIPIQQDAYIKTWILPYLLPQVTDADNGKTMKVVNGTWQMV